MAKVTLSPFEPGDLPAVFALYAKVFGDPARVRFERRYAWSRLHNLAPERTAAWVLKGETGALLGYLGAVPLPYRVEGERLWAHSTADFMVDTSASFHGISLLRECVKRFPSQLSFDDVAATKALLGLMKAKPVLELARWAKPLDARLLKQHRPEARLVPDLLLAPARPLLRLADRLRRPLRLPRAVPVPFDRLFDDFAAAHCGRVGASVYRDAAYYRWRYGPTSPQARAVTLGLVRFGKLEGYAVACASEGELPAGTVLELYAAPDAPPDTTLALVVGATRHLRDAGCVVAYAPVAAPDSSALADALSLMGFVKRAHRLTMLARVVPGALPPLVLDAATWNVQYGDAEHSHGAV